MSSIAILGAGFTGLTTAYYLSLKGFQVSLLEKDPWVGGLAAGFKKPEWDWSLEYFYHHWFANDTYVKKLLKDLNLTDGLLVFKPTTSVFYKNQVLPLDSPISLLKFPYLSWRQKIQAAAVIAYLKSSPFWQGLEKQTADQWLTRNIGAKAYQRLFRPLLVSKFGSHAKNVNAAWFWARIHKRTKRLLYYYGGFQSFLEKFAGRLGARGVKIYLGHRVTKIAREKSGFKLFIDNGQKLFFDKIVLTCQVPQVLSLIDFFSADYQQRLSRLSFLDSQTLILSLEKPLMPKTYWLNINESNWPFLAAVEHTNFVDKAHYDNRHLVYLVNYLMPNSPLLSTNKEDLFKKFLPFLQKINPQFTPQLLKESFLFVRENTQPVMPINYSHHAPAITTPIDNLYLANQSCIYPFDRGTNYAIELGEKAAQLISKREL